jgi:hypothetical protein
MQQLKEQEGLEVLQPELGTKPRVYYKNMHLMTQCFVSGSVVVAVDGIEECAENADVILKQDGREFGRATTDTFGEFKIDQLEKNSGQYELDVTGTSGSLSMQFNLGDESLYLGTLMLAT